MVFSSDNQPSNRKSGPNIKAKIVAALGRVEMSEDDFLDVLINKAVNEGGVFLQEVLKRYSPIPRQTHEPIVIESWPKDGTATEKAEAILNCMSDGQIPPDLGALFVESISKSLGIEEVTDFAQRLEALEKLADAKKT